MSDVIVSVRMPASLAQALKKLAVDHHYMDVSEEIRSIVRSKIMEYAEPYAQELKKFRIDLRKELENRQKDTTNLAKELERIAMQLKNE